MVRIGKILVLTALVWVSSLPSCAPNLTTRGSGGDSGGACADGVKNGSETDIDCGGAGCEACAAGKGCSGAADCTTGICLNNVCQAITCTDGMKNGSETDIDCGGPDCGPCSPGNACGVPTDCDSNLCTGSSCAAPSCSDNTKNGSETDSDCGGLECAPCSDGKSCNDATDCNSKVCTGNQCTMSCTDGVQNGAESDIDCGGNCPGCVPGKTCSNNSDCATNVCAGNQCVAAGCTDNTKNGMETDVDCGGPDCTPCDTNATCQSPKDCLSGVCTDAQCAAPTCSDNIKNGGETDVDCGGPNCNGCDVGKACATLSDCSTKICTGNLCAMPDFVGATVRDVTTSFTIAIPTDTIPGDLLLLLVAHGGGSSSIPGPPPGWTEIEDGSKPGGDPKLDAFYTTYTSGSSVAVMLSSTNGSAILAAFRGFTYGAKGTLELSASDTITTAQNAALLFISMTNNGGQVPGMPTGFTSLAVGNGNSRSVRLSYSKNNPQGTYKLDAVAPAGESMPKSTLALALY